MTNLQVCEFQKFKNELDTYLKQLSDRINALETVNNTLVQENTELKRKVEDLETKLGVVEEVNKTVPQTRLFSSLFEKKRQDNFELNLLNVVKTNCEEEKIKGKNILIFGTKFNENKEEDDRLVNDIFREIGVRRGKIQFVKRFKKKDESETSPILVELKTRTDKIEVFKNEKNNFFWLK